MRHIADRSARRLGARTVRYTDHAQLYAEACPASVTKFLAWISRDLTKAIWSQLATCLELIHSVRRWLKQPLEERWKWQHQHIAYGIRKRAVTIRLVSMVCCSRCRSAPFSGRCSCCRSFDRKLMFLCHWGIHRWHKREATFRPGTTIHRCQRCEIVRVKHRRKSAPSKPVE